MPASKNIKKQKSPDSAEQSEEPIEHSSPDREAQAVDAEQPPRLPFPLVAIGASAGGLEAFAEFFDAMPPDSGIAFVLIQHLPPERESLLPEILQRHTKMPVLQIEDGMAVKPDHVYTIRPGHTLTIKKGLLHLGERLGKPGHNRPVDDFFRALSEEQQERAIGIIMSGMGSNGSAGAQTIKAVGGICIAQEPESAKFPSMPRHLIDHGMADFILRPAEMPAVLLRYIKHPYAKGAREQTQVLLQSERRQFDDILGIIRTRMRNDFSGYRKPTILRRIQRRLGLHQITHLAEYGKLLRQNPTEVHALADDLMIHVTGFFRDPEVWESLSNRVIRPLIAERESDAQIRCWVTACSSGEEAYTLAILLAEAAFAANKRPDIKVFATDTAERSVLQARSGVFPGGIEAEVTPQRLERFFEREDSLYRVKKELREMVVFAPHNLLNDPPFSRLDIVTCRNLLIYLEPEVQQKLLATLHFGLREGGCLLLGSSETVASSGQMFDPIDKKLRIYRRVGPTRHGSFDFPTLRSDVVKGGNGDSRQLPRVSVAQITNKVLLDQYTPAAVTLDRDHRIAYYHGNTETFLLQPRGEPTRDVLAVAREGVRAVLRAALEKFNDGTGELVSADGVIQDNRHGRRRITVTVAPLESKLLPGHILVSFQEREIAASAETIDATQADDTIQNAQVSVGRLRDELQSTIEELQSSNEELRASNEEVTSVNEELQSANEEMETSKEELQSLNEELTTANSQLQAKMDELESMTSDLKSLLSSTDIAVIFLDNHFRIRRYTPAVKDLMDLIPADIGRPISDMAMKFDDRDLLTDARLVLERLVPIAREIVSQSGHYYLRRTLPYRTSDNRIDGIVLTFVDITERKLAEQSLEHSKMLAEEQVKMKDDFVATLSHELRTPLSAILLWSKLLREKKVDYSGIEEGLRLIEKSAEAQCAMVEDLLDTSRIATGKLRIERRIVNLKSIIQSAIDAVLPTAATKHITINANMDDVGSALLDPERVQQILWNLLSNAVKFTPQDGSISVDIRRDSDAVEIIVSDTGVGISKEFLNEMFVRFRQADSSATRRHGGLGLGLAISKQLAELHGGTIAGYSDGPGKGSKFVVRLPVGSADGAARSNGNGNSKSAPPDGELSRDGSVVESNQLSGIHVLLVEDNEDTRTALTRFLQVAGAAVIQTSNAMDAINIYEKQAPDLIISDIGMPGMDGCEMLGRIRGIEKERTAEGVPAIALTAFSLEKDRRRIMEAGFNWYAHKPIEPSQLIPIIKIVMRKS